MEILQKFVKIKINSRQRWFYYYFFLYNIDPIQRYSHQHHSLSSAIDTLLLSVSFKPIFVDFAFVFNHRKKFRVAWYWNLGFFISEYLHTGHTRRCITRAALFFKNVPGTFFQRDASGESNCNRSFRGQPAGQIDWLLLSSSLNTYSYPI